MVFFKFFFCFSVICAFVLIRIYIDKQPINLPLLNQFCLYPLERRTFYRYICNLISFISYFDRALTLKNSPGWHGQLVARVPKEQEGEFNKPVYLFPDKPFCAARTGKICQCHPCNRTPILFHSQSLSNQPVGTLSSQVIPSRLSP
jgi:hypothetical protein